MRRLSRALRRGVALGVGARRWTTSWPPCLRSARGTAAAGVDSAEEEGSLSALAAEATSAASSQQTELAPIKGLAIGPLRWISAWWAMLVQC